MAALYGSGTSVKTELLIDNVWTDISTRPRAAQKAVIRRGRANEQGLVAAQTASLTLENIDGALSNRNPNSPLYGKIGRNTQTRITAGAGDYYLKAVYTDSLSISNVSTADKAVLDITGDIDIRCDIQPYAWRGQAFTFASKAQDASSQYSWWLACDESGFLQLLWSTAGTAGTILAASATVAIPSTSKRLTVRATLDVNNGASGRTAAFYTSDSVTGAFTQLGASVVQAGTTSIFSSSADLVFAGGHDDAQQSFVNSVGFGGRFYRGQVYSGIAGTLRADMNASAQTVGALSWSDGLSTPNTWTVNGTGSVRVTTDRLRFWGELASVPQTWDITGKDVTITATASGMIRRLTQGANPLSSAMRRNFNRYSPAGYWPLEDSSGATTAGSAVRNGRAGQITAAVFGATDLTLPGAASVASFTDATSAIKLTAASVPSTGTASFAFYVRAGGLPASQKVIARLSTSGTVKTIQVSLSATAWVTDFLASDGSTLATSSSAFAGIDPSLNWVGYNVLLKTSGSNITFSIRWDSVSTYGGGVGPTTISTATVGVPTGAFFTSTDAVFNSNKYAHVFMSTSAFDLSSDVFRKASSAWVNETAIARLLRLAAEEGIALEAWGLAAQSEPMGYQTVDTFINLVYDCSDTDGGILGECRDRLALLYRSRTALELRADVTLNYSSSHLSAVPVPTDDDQAFTNDVTVSRPGGSSARAARTEGPTSISPPPVGVGGYATAITRNAASDARLPSIAGWKMLTGSWDDVRYPSLEVGLHRTEIDAVLFGQMLALELGDTATMTGMPSQQPPDAVPELVQGYTETLDKFLWTTVLNTSPAGPYLAVGVIGSDNAIPRLDAIDTQTLNGTMTTTSLTFDSTAPGYPNRPLLWITTAANAADFPFAIKVAGEIMTCTGIVNLGSGVQRFTVIRSVNGIVKAHAANEMIRLANPTYLGS